MLYCTQGNTPACLDGYLETSGRSCGSLAVFYSCSQQLLDRDEFILPSGECHTVTGTLYSTERKKYLRHISLFSDFFFPHYTIHRTSQDLRFLGGGLPGSRLALFIRLLYGHTPHPLYTNRDNLWRSLGTFPREGEDV